MPDFRVKMIRVTHREDVRYVVVTAENYDKAISKVKANVGKMFKESSDGFDGPENRIRPATPVSATIVRG